MRKWKRLLLCLCAVLAAGVAFIFWASRDRTGSAVSLSFVGYINVPIPTSSRSDITYSLPKALISATNHGSVPIALDSAIRNQDFWNRINTTGHHNTTGFTPPIGTGLPKILKPGESSILEVWAGSELEFWWTEIRCRRLGPWERAYGWAWNHASPTVQRNAFRFVPAPKEFWVKAGPFTNQPPPARIIEVRDFPALPVDYQFGSPQFPPNSLDLIQTKP